MNRIKLTPHLSVEDLKFRYRRSAEPTERSRWQILWLLSKGQLAREVAESTGYSAYWIGQIARRYNREGPAGMVNRCNTTSHHAVPLLSAAQREELRRATERLAPQSERWTSMSVAQWMSERLRRPAPKQRGWDYLQRLNARLLLPRPRHVAASVEEQAAFKKTPPPEPDAGDRPSHRSVRDLGDRRASHWPQTTAQARLDLARATPHRAG